MLASALSSRSFVVTAELGPPRDPDPELVRAGARALAGSVDAVNITDNQAATVKLSRSSRSPAATATSWPCSPSSWVRGPSACGRS